MRYLLVIPQNRKKKMTNSINSDISKMAFHSICITSLNVQTCIQLTSQLASVNSLNLFLKKQITNKDIFKKIAWVKTCLLNTNILENLQQSNPSCLLWPIISALVISCNYSYHQVNINADPFHYIIMLIVRSWY